MGYDIIIGRDESDKKDFENKGLIYIGKGFVKMGQYTSLSNKIFLDVIRTHIILIAGKRGSGKSYTIGVFAEQLADLPKEVSQNIASIIFDTMGIYWTMKYQNEKDRELLEEWGLTPKNLPVKIFVPYGHFDEYAEKGIPVDKKFALDITEMSAEDWIMAFKMDLIDPVGVLIQTTIVKLEEDGKKFYIEEIINEIEKEKNSSRDAKNAAIGLFQAADSWGIFARKGTKQTNIIELVTAGITTVLDLSVYKSIGAFTVRALVVSLVSRKLFEQRMASRKKEEINSIVKRFEIKGEAEKKEMPLIWMFIDEAHEFLPLNKKTIATDALVQLLREGRQPGISMILATQQPGKIHRDVMTQSDVILSHKVTSKQDLSALNQIMQSYMLESISKYMNELPNLKGSGIILDDTSERIYPMRIHPRFTWHGGEAPTSVKREKKL